MATVDQKPKFFKSQFEEEDDENDQSSASMGLYKRLQKKPPLAPSKSKEEDKEQNQSDRENIILSVSGQPFNLAKKIPPNQKAVNETTLRKMLTPLQEVDTEQETSLTSDNAYHRQKTSHSSYSKQKESPSKAILSEEDISSKKLPVFPLNSKIQEDEESPSPTFKSKIEEDKKKELEKIGEESQEEEKKEEPQIIKKNKKMKVVEDTLGTVEENEEDNLSSQIDIGESLRKNDKFKEELKSLKDFSSIEQIEDDETSKFTPSLLYHKIASTITESQTDSVKEKPKEKVKPPFMKPTLSKEYPQEIDIGSKPEEEEEEEEKKMLGMNLLKIPEVTEETQNSKLVEKESVESEDKDESQKEIYSKEQPQAIMIQLIKMEKEKKEKQMKEKEEEERKKKEKQQFKVIKSLKKQKKKDEEMLEYLSKQGFDLNEEQKMKFLQSGKIDLATKQKKKEKISPLNKNMIPNIVIKKSSIIEEKKKEDEHLNNPSAKNSIVQSPRSVHDGDQDNLLELPNSQIRRKSLSFREEEKRLEFISYRIRSKHSNDSNEDVVSDEEKEKPKGLPIIKSGKDKNKRKNQQLFLKKRAPSKNLNSAASNLQYLYKKIKLALSVSPPPITDKYLQDLIRYNAFTNSEKLECDFLISKFKKLFQTIIPSKKKLRKPNKKIDQIVGCLPNHLKKKGKEDIEIQNYILKRKRKFIYFILSFSLEEIHSMFWEFYKSFDTDHSLKLEEKEFASCINYFAKDSLFSKQGMKEVFNIMGKGIMSKGITNLKEGHIEGQEFESNVYAKAFKAMADKNNKGEVSFNKFFPYLLLFFLVRQEKSIDLREEEFKKMIGNLDEILKAEDHNIFVEKARMQTMAAGNKAKKAKKEEEEKSKIKPDGLLASFMKAGMSIADFKLQRPVLSYKIIEKALIDFRAKLHEIFGYEQLEIILRSVRKKLNVDVISKKEKKKIPFNVRSGILAPLIHETIEEGMKSEVSSMKEDESRRDMDKAKEMNEDEVEEVFGFAEWLTVNIGLQIMWNFMKTEETSPELLKFVKEEKFWKFNLVKDFFSEEGIANLLENAYRNTSEYKEKIRAQRPKRKPFRKKIEFNEEDEEEEDEDDDENKKLKNKKIPKEDVIPIRKEDEGPVILPYKLFESIFVSAVRVVIPGIPIEWITEMIYYFFNSFAPYEFEYNKKLKFPNRKYPLSLEKLGKYFQISIHDNEKDLMDMFVACSCPKINPVTQKMEFIGSKAEKIPSIYNMTVRRLNYLYTKGFVNFTEFKKVGFKVLFKYAKQRCYSYILTIGKKKSLDNHIMKEIGPDRLLNNDSFIIEHISDETKNKLSSSEKDDFKDKVRVLLIASNFVELLPMHLKKKQRKLMEESNEAAKFRRGKEDEESFKKEILKINSYQHEMSLIPKDPTILEGLLFESQKQKNKSVQPYLKTNKLRFRLKNEATEDEEKKYAATSFQEKKNTILPTQKDRSCGVSQCYIF